MSKTTAQIIADDPELSKNLSEIFLWVGRCHSVERAVRRLRDKLREKYDITFETYT